MGVFSFSHPHLSFRVFRVFRGSNRCSPSPLFCGSLALPILFSRPDTRHNTANEEWIVRYRRPRPDEAVFRQFPKAVCSRLLLARLGTGKVADIHGRPHR